MSQHTRLVRAVPGTDLDGAAAAPRLRASWRRSQHYGVHADEVQPVFAGPVDTGSLLFECGSQVLSGLHATLANEPVSLMIADRDGLVLSRLCSDSAIRRSLDKVHLAPGFYYDEQRVGTNGLGLSLADRAPALVRAAEHYCTALRGYTCAAAPVLDPLSGEIAGSVNLTTWSDRSSELLLALAQAAAGNTTALMLVRATGRTLRPAPRGEVFHVVADRLPSAHSDPCCSALWRSAVVEAGAAVAAGRVVAVVGEPGAGKVALAAQARPAGSGREQLVNVRPPAGPGIDSWLDLWTPELATRHTCVIVSAVDTLPAWAAGELAQQLRSAVRHDGAPQPFVLTAADFASIPEQLATLVDTVVEAPPLRHRPADVMVLAGHFARQVRRRDVTFTAAAQSALTAFDWPNNVRELRRIVREAAARADVIDVRHLAAHIFTEGGHNLTRLEAVERDEIVRCLTEGDTTIGAAAERLGMGRATLYRKIAQYHIVIPRRR